jgi:hypothetical protein
MSRESGCGNFPINMDVHVFRRKNEVMEKE